MKKIKAKHDKKDRIICVTSAGKHDFYYVPVGTKERFWLLNTKDFSGSIFGFFRKNGRNMDGRGFSLTIKEIYEIGKSKNDKINKIMDRIPNQIEYVIRENCLNGEKEGLLFVDMEEKSFEFPYSEEIYEYVV